MEEGADGLPADTEGVPPKPQEPIRWEEWGNDADAGIPCRVRVHLQALPTSSGWQILERSELDTVWHESPLTEEARQHIENELKKRRQHTAVIPRKKELLRPDEVSHTRVTLLRVRHFLQRQRAAATSILRVKDRRWLSRRWKGGGKRTLGGWK